MFGKPFRAHKHSQQTDAYETSTPEPRQYAPGTKLGFDPQLIERFKGHHVVLLKLFGRIKQSAQAGDYPRTMETVATFKSALQQHLLEENIRFYTYLRVCLQKDPESARLMHAMKSEMEAIGRTVIRFISHYLEFGINEGNIKKFLSDVKDIGAALEDRITREESSLYTLYQPPSSY